MADSSFADLTRRLEAALTVDLIATYTPLTNAREQDSSAVLKQMEETGFDILPVDHAVTSYWVRPELLSSSGQEPMLQTLTAADLVASGTSIPELLRLMVGYGRRFYFLLRGAEVTGLITYADLNKRAARAALYTLVSELEETLIRVFEQAHPDEADWREWLQPDSYRELTRLRNRAKKRAVELSAVRYATLGELIRLLQSSRKISPVLERLLGPGWAASLDQLRARARNAVAHPGNLLVQSADDVATICSTYEFAETAVEKLVENWEATPV
jgi:hypothetical protein